MSSMMKTDVFILSTASTARSARTSRRSPCPGRRGPRRGRTVQGRSPGSRAGGLGPGRIPCHTAERQRGQSGRTAGMRGQTRPDKTAQEEHARIGLEQPIFEPAEARTQAIGYYGSGGGGTARRGRGLVPAKGALASRAARWGGCHAREHEGRAAFRLGEILPPPDDQDREQAERSEQVRDLAASVGGGEVAGVVVAGMPAMSGATRRCPSTAKRCSRSPRSLSRPVG